MNENNEALAIIPARSGSKRLANKNSLILNGKPLIAWTIEAAVESGVFDEIVVNTDCQEIAAIAKQYGAKVPFIRPSYLAEDNTPTIDVVNHTLEWYHAKQAFFSEVVLLQPTSPLRNKTIIREAWDLYLQSRAESVVSVCELDHPIQWTYSLNEDFKLSALFEDNKKRSQDCEKYYRLNGAIYITKTKLIVERKEIFSETKSVAYVMPKFQSIDIDEKEDFEFIEFLMSRS